jgi:hypothetical protein
VGRAFGASRAGATGAGGDTAEVGSTSVFLADRLWVAAALFGLEAAFRMGDSTGVAISFSAVLRLGILNKNIKAEKHFDYNMFQRLKV